MTGRDDMDAPGAVGQPLFATTHWSVVLAAQGKDAPDAAFALEQLCRTYWYPLYSYLRRRNYTHEDAQDLTQGYLLQLLQRNSFARVDSARGRFRSFLLAGLKYYVADQHDLANTQKRGGGVPALSFFDVQTAQERYRLEPVDQQSPDKLFERRWALTLLDVVLKELEQGYRNAGKAELFDKLQVFLVEGPGEQSYGQAAAEMGMSPEAVKKAVQRMRRRYCELFHEQIAHTVADPSEVEDEMRHLCAVISS